MMSSFTNAQARLSSSSGSSALPYMNEFIKLPKLPLSAAPYSIAPSALADGCVTEKVITRLRKRNETLTNEQDQYKEALYTLNKEVTKLNEKLKEESHQWEKEQEAKATLEKELTTLLGQVETAMADVITELKASQPFIDACAFYYGDKFEDCLKQVKSIYPHLDLSKVTMDDPLPSTPIGDTIFEDIEDST
ncbi:hypothetical protein SO802_007161 [Lithocarpus litseifolius]|uniref:Uncharacterized protein n=1 Tax=Lithocarpus litseifolius TaxID=425828 RepID=A0AAW2DR52_9ROSI